MEEQIKQIADRIRGLRDIYDISAAEMAAKLEIPPDIYQSYESGSVDIPVSILCRLAHTFKMELSSLLTGEEPRLHTYSLTRKGKGVSVERRKEYKYQSLASNFVNKKVEPFIVTVEPKDRETAISLNSHPGHEFNYILEGALKIVVGKSEMTLTEGDSLYFDSTVEHGMLALNGKPAKFLAIIL
jgi:mannose-6-phosphate isomerase-like protein (cupin superfamily)